MPNETIDPPHHEIPRARLIGLGLLIALGLWIARDFIAALIWGLVIAIAIDPLHMRMRARWSRFIQPWHLALILTTGVALLVLIPLLLGLAQAAMEARELALWVASVRAHGIPVPAWLEHLPYGGRALTRWWGDHLANPRAASEQLHRFANGDVIAHTRLIGRSVVHRATIFAFTLIALFFLLRDRDAIVAQIRAAGSKLFGPASEKVGEQAIQSVRGTIDGLVLVGMGEGLVMAVVYLVLGVPHPLLLGALTAIAAMIPFGAALMFLIAAALLVAAGAATNAVILIVIGLVVVGIADHFIRPVLIGGATRLPFLWVLIGILGGAETFGILGLFVGPAVMAILIMLWRDFVGTADKSVAPARTGRK
jgi:predicted PurR-regulated permease PerM